MQTWNADRWRWYHTALLLALAVGGIALWLAGE